MDSQNRQGQAGTEPQDSFDLDAALEEKFQEVRQDVQRMQTLEEPPASEPASEPVPMPEPTSEPDFIWTEEPESEPEPDTAQAASEEIEPNVETDPTLASNDTAKDRKQRYKRRRAMLISKNFSAVLRIFSLGVLLFGGSIFLLVGARPTESAEENRTLATFPAFTLEGLGDGSYISGVMEYYEDTVPGRSTFKHLISKMQQYMGLQADEEDAVTFIGNVEQVTKETTAPAVSTTVAASEATGTDSTNTGTGTDTAETTTVTTTVTTEPEEEPVEVGDGIVLVGDRAISVYGGSFTRGEAYASALNAYKQDLGEDVNVYSLVAPTSVSFYLPDSYSGYTGSEIDNINHINENLNGVIPIDAYSILEEHQDEEIYARTDHHWLPLGAYYAAESFAETAGLSFAPLSDYTATTKQGYVGSMYTFTKSAVLEENPEDFTYYAPKNSYTTTYYDTDFTNPREGNLLINLDQVEPVSWYLVFMGGDEKITHVSTDVDNGRTLVVVKDSYGNALIPCLTGSFSEIYVTDMRYLDVNAVDFMKQVGATDVLFAMNTFSATGSNCEYLEGNRTK